MEENSLRAIIDGIRDGLEEIGFELSDREKKFIAMTVRSTVRVIEKVGERIDQE